MSNSVVEEHDLGHPTPVGAERGIGRPTPVVEEGAKRASRNQSTIRRIVSTCSLSDLFVALGQQSNQFHWVLRN